MRNRELALPTAPRASGPSRDGPTLDAGPLASYSITCSNRGMRWSRQSTAEVAGPLQIPGLLRTTASPEFSGMRFHEVMAKTALNRVPARSSMPFSWTVNPYRGCSHACVYCFARNTHTYLDLDAGEDFDREVVVKVNVADVVRAETGRRSWAREQVALGTNTDPYQRAEGRYQLMPGIVEVLADSGTPLSILTKGTLLRRDLPLLARAAEDVPVDLAMSIAVFDDHLQNALEPGTPTTKARLVTVRAAADRGFRVSVFLMPVLPYLTDSTEQLDDALRAIAEAGAQRVITGPLHLRPGAREWFLRWIRDHRPDLTSAYQGMYARSAYAPQAYRRVLARRIRPLIDRYGLAGTDDDDTATGGFAADGTAVAGTAANGIAAAGERRSAVRRAVDTATQPALF